MMRAAMMTLVTLAVLWAATPPAVLAADEAISLRLFRDGIHHWQNTHGDDYAAYPPEQVREIADNLLRYQRSNGGWPPNIDPLRILSEKEIGELASDRNREDTSFDNRASYPQVEYLAAALARTGDERYRQAAERGLAFLLDAQYDNGGWPHSYPRDDGYRKHVTIVDDVMSGILTTLRRVTSGEPPFDALDPQLLARARGALARGEACLLGLQIEVDGQLTGWASQYDRQTLRPTTGRSFELPALISSESVTVLRYLMSIDQPTPEVRRAIHAGAAWLARSSIRGYRLERVPAETIRYEHHTSTDDVVLVADATAPPLWARFYEIETNRPFMANRDGKKVYRLADVERERRTGYSWYGRTAQSLLEKEYPAWKNTWGDK